MKTAVGYERYSSRSQSETSIAVQKAAIERFCEENCIKVIRHYSDMAISGQNVEKRAMFKRMMNDIDSLGVDYVIVYSLDRFSRSVKDTVNCLMELSEKGCVLKSVTEKLGNESPSDSLSRWIQIALGEYYVANLRKEVLRGLRHNAHNGIWNNKPPFGYERDSETKKLVPNSIEAPGVLRMFQLLAKGVNKCEITRILEDEGYRKRDGSLIGRGIVEHALDDKKYIGEFKYTITALDPEVIVIPGAMPALVSKELFNRAKEITSSKARGRKSNPMRRYYSSHSAIEGKTFCGYSGNRLITYIATYDDEFDMASAYMKPSRKNRSQKLCKEIQASETNALMEVFFDRILFGDGNLSGFSSFLGQIAEKAIEHIDEEIEAQKSVIARNELKVTEIIDRMTKGESSDIQPLLDEISSIKSENVYIESRIDSLEFDKPIAQEGIRKRINSAVNHKKTAFLQGKTDFIRNAIERLIVYDGRFVIRFDPKAFFAQLFTINAMKWLGFEAVIQLSDAQDEIGQILRGHKRFPDYCFRRSV